MVNFSKLIPQAEEPFLRRKMISRDREKSCPKFELGAQLSRKIL